MQLAAKLQTRDALIEEYRHYVRNVAIKMVRYMNLPIQLVDEFIAAGYLGLVEAAERFRPESGSDFKKYAFLRIRGAIIDSIRHSSQLSGKAYHYAKAMQSSIELQEELQHLEREPTLSIANKQDAKRRLAQLLDFTAKSLLTFKLSLCEVSQEVEKIVDQSGNQEENMISAQETKVFLNLVETLPEKERLIIKAHYFYGKSFHQITKDYEGLSKSWVSRLHVRALERLKKSYLQHKANSAQ